MIELTKLRYGPGYFQSPGTQLQLSPYEEQQLVNAGAARQVETADAQQRSQPETASRPLPNRRKRG